MRKAPSPSTPQEGSGPQMEESYPHELRLPLAPYRFVWDRDGSVVIIRNYSADGSFHLLSDRGPIELIDNAGDYRAPNPVSVVRLP
jgi:hypothetical protein